jgi:uncharacterized protein
MNTEERREKLLDRLERTDKPLTGTALAREFAVSRQIIVGDISIIRAMGKNIYATPRGYIIPSEQKEKRMVLATLCCRHGADNVQKELDIVVDNGGFVRDVIVEHPLYGEIRCDLMLATRRDVANFVRRMQECRANPLSVVTGGVHLHTIEISDKAALLHIQKDLREEGILVEEA